MVAILSITDEVVIILMLTIVFLAVFFIGSYLQRKADKCWESKCRIWDEHFDAIKDKYSDEIKIMSMLAVDLHPGSPDYEDYLLKLKDFLNNIKEKKNNNAQ